MRTSRLDFDLARCAAIRASRRSPRSRQNRHLGSRRGDGRPEPFFQPRQEAGLNKKWGQLQKSRYQSPRGGRSALELCRTRPQFHYLETGRRSGSSSESRSVRIWELLRIGQRIRYGKAGPRLWLRYGLRDGFRRCSFSQVVLHISRNFEEIAALSPQQQQGHSAGIERSASI